MNLKSAIETLLFVHGEPMEEEKIAKILKEKKDAVAAALNELREDYRGRGFALLKKDNEWQLATNPEHAPFIEALVKNEFSEELSRAALETIAIVAYRGPLTRAQIEFVRGVNSSFTLRNLLMRGLVERINNPKDSRSYLYRVSFDFLKHFGLTRIEELPEFEMFRAEKIEVLDGGAASDASQSDSSATRGEESEKEVSQ